MGRRGSTCTQNVSIWIVMTAAETGPAARACRRDRARELADALLRIVTALSVISASRCPGVADHGPLRAPLAWPDGRRAGLLFSNAAYCQLRQIRQA
jgi:hypothetical protein